MVARIQTLESKGVRTGVRVLPAIDYQAGGCARLIGGRLDAGVPYLFDCHRWLNEAKDAGASQVHVVDVDGAAQGSPRQTAAIAALAREAGLELQTGGGLRRGADLAAVLEAGATRAVVGTAAFEQAEAVSDWITVFGREHVAVSLDVMAVDGELRVGSLSRAPGGGPSLWKALDRLRYAGLKHVVLSDRDREGGMEGPNLELISTVTRRRPDLWVQYGGGVRSADDVVAVKAAGASAVLIGRAFMTGALEPRAAFEVA